MAVEAQYKKGPANGGCARNFLQRDTDTGVYTVGRISRRILKDVRLLDTAGEHHEERKHKICLVATRILFNR